MSDVEEAKKNAAKAALKYVDGASVVGVGTGSTVEKFIELLGSMARDYRDRVFVASSLDTMLKLRGRGFKVVYPGVIDYIDVYVDGADEVDPGLNMIKGGGAALTLEKILTYYSRERIFIVDYRKLVKKLGEKHSIPIEVLPWAVSMVYSYLKNKGYNPVIRSARMGKYGPVVSDVGGVIVDIKPSSFDPLELERELKMLPGVIETGLFIGMADRVIVGWSDRVEVLVSRRPVSTGQ